MLIFSANLSAATVGSVVQSARSVAPEGPSGQFVAAGEKGSQQGDQSFVSMLDHFRKTGYLIDSKEEFIFKESIANSVAVPLEVTAAPGIEVTQAVVREHGGDSTDVADEPVPEVPSGFVMALPPFEPMPVPVHELLSGRILPQSSVALPLMLPAAEGISTSMIEATATVPFMTQSQQDVVSAPMLSSRMDAALLVQPMPEWTRLGPEQAVSAHPGEGSLEAFVEADGLGALHVRSPRAGVAAAVEVVPVPDTAMAQTEGDAVRVHLLQERMNPRSPQAVLVQPGDVPADAFRHEPMGMRMDRVAGQVDPLQSMSAADAMRMEGVTGPVISALTALERATGSDSGGGASSATAVLMTHGPTPGAASALGDKVLPAPVAPFASLVFGTGRELASDLDARVRWFSAHGIGTAEIRLDPPELGPLQVTIHAQREGASVHFTAATVQVRELLEHSLPRLRELLESGGMSLVDVNVGQQGQGGSEHGQPSTGSGGSTGIGVEPGETHIHRHGVTVAQKHPGSRLIDAYV